MPIKLLTIVVFMLIMAMFVFGLLFPPAKAFIGIVLLSSSLALASIGVVKKQKESYRQGKISRFVYLRNVILEVTGILLTMILAGFLGRCIAEIATRQINNDLTKIVVGILVGLSVGISIGILAKMTREKLFPPLANQPE